jgi:hypothetical protein
MNMMHDLGAIDPPAQSPQDRTALDRVMAGEFAEGLFFGLPDEVHHAIPALSASGIKWLRVSTMDYWARQRWLNPNYEEDNEEVADSTARELGKAYHKRILEGREAFMACYAPAFDPSAHEGALENADAIKDALRKHKENGADVKLSGKKADMIANLLDLDPSAKIMDVLRESHEDAHDGMTFLPANVLRKIELSAAVIEKDPELGKLFRGGASEVTMCFICPDTGCPCKLRFDYIKPRDVIDLKSFANKMAMPVNQAVAREFANNRYPFQGAWYREGARHIKRMIRESRVYGDAPPELLKGLLADHPKTFTYVFMQKGPAPVARGRRLLPESSIYTLAKAKNDEAKVLFQRCREHFKDDPWVSPEPIDDFRDEEVPAYATD